MSKNNKSIISHLKTADWISISLYFVPILIYLFFYYGFVEGVRTAASWLYSSWNPQTDYEHGWMVPLLAAYMFVHAIRQLREAPPHPSLHGLWSVVIGCLLCLVASRSQQPRLAIGAIPFLITGAVWCYLGTRAMTKTLFPVFFLWLSIPLPGFQQATVGMQQLAAQLAHWGAGICGVQTILEGTTVASTTSNWDSFSIAGGCSGMRSLMALLMISVAWGYLADKLSLWKRVVLALSALPLAILGNGFRVCSIFVCAEYINPAFAGKTWHDWSGLMFFFPISLLGLIILHSLLAGEIPFFQKRTVITRRNNTKQEGEAHS